jgi:hypothetical protein
MVRTDPAPAAPTSAPRFALAWAALTYAIGALALGFPALAGRFLVSPHSDQYIAGYAYRDFAAQALRAGTGFPEWNPYLFGGVPYIAGMAGDIFYPTFLLRMALPTDVAMTWGFILHVFLAGLFTYGFLRAWGLGFFGALVGGMAYMMGGPIASYVSPGHDGKLFVSALFPLALWLIVRGVRDARAWAWGGLAITIGLAVLSPHPQLLQYMLLACGSFALFVALGRDASGRRLDRRTMLTRLALALGAVVLGFVIGAIQYAPVREYVAWSPRAGGLGYEHATSYSFPPVELVNLYLPQFTGILDQYWGPNLIHFHSEYLGAAVLLLAAAAFGGDAERGFRRFWIGAGIVAFLWMLGGSTPFFHIVYAIVPGTKFFRAPSTIIFVFGFAVSVLAALGTERVLAGRGSRRLALGWVIAAGVIALLATSGALTSLASSIAAGIGADIAERQGMSQAAAQIADQWSARANGNAPDLILGAWRALLFVALAAGTWLAVQRGRIDRRLGGVLLVAIVGADLWSVEREYWQFMPPAKTLYASDPAIEYLKRQPEPGRVLVRATSDEGLASPDPYFGTRGDGTGTGLMIHGIRSVTGYHGNEIGRYQSLVQTPLEGGGSSVATPGFWRHENVRYLYTNAALPDSSLQRLLGPVRNSSGSTVYLYRLPGENPYAWVASAATKAPDAAARAAVLDPRFDPLRIAVLDSTVPLQTPPLASLPQPSSVTASTSRFAPGQARIDLSAPAPAGAVLVVSENYFPGWRATVDGRDAPVYRANFNLLGVPLPTGGRSVQLSFHDPAYSTGKLLTDVALALSVLLLIGGVARDRMRGRTVA